MSILNAGDAITRLKENEERIDLFVNSNNPYNTNEVIPRSVESFPHFIARKETELNTLVIQAAHEANINATFYAATEVELMAAQTTDSIKRVSVIASFALTANRTITKPLRIEPGNKITTTGYVLTINGRFDDTGNQAFVCSNPGELIFGINAVTGVGPELIGGIGDNSTDCLLAFRVVNAALTSGFIKLSNGTYCVSACFKATLPIKGNGPNVSIIKNTGTGDALYLGLAGYYALFENFSVEGNASSRDGISLWNSTDGGNLAYSQFRSVYSYGHGRHGLYHRRAWGTKYDSCKFGKETKGNGGLGVYLDTEVLNEGTHNAILFIGCESRWNGGNSKTTTFADDKGGIKIKGAANVLWLGGVIESNNAWGVIVVGVPSIAAARDIHFRNVYTEFNPMYATVGGNFYCAGPWSNFTVKESWLAYGGPNQAGFEGQTGYNFYITEGEQPNDTKFIEENNTNVAVGASGGTDILYYSASRSYAKNAVKITEPFGDIGASGSIVNTTLLTISNDGIWSLSGFIHFTRNSDNVGLSLPFKVSNATGTRQVVIGTTVVGASSQAPTLAFSGDDLVLTTPAYCHAYVELTEGLASPPTTLNYNSSLFGVFMRRK